MFTASQLLDKINNHLSENQITRTPEGLYEPIEYILWGESGFVLY